MTTSTTDEIRDTESLRYAAAVSPRPRRVLRIRNSYTRTIEPFVPLDPDGHVVTMYTCGPTVYSFAHIGNFRSFLLADVLRRVLEQHGYEVRQVMNVTDVGHLTQDHVADASGEDKLSKAARELGTDPYTIAAHFERAFAEDAGLLQLRAYQGAQASDSALHPRATRHVPEMLAMIQALLDRGFAYIDGSGQVYFEVSKFSDYGKLSGKVLEDLELGARIAVRDEKRDPRDFALWKVDDKHLMRWDPHHETGWPDGDWARLRALVPGGIDPRIQPGFPGWHIECSAMARAHLGDCIDIHTGGEDNAFPHHECEIAQSHGALGITTVAPPGAPDDGQERTSFARYWVHGRHLLVDGHKMSKRDGTFFTVRDLLDPTGSNRPELTERLAAVGFVDGKVPATVLRYALLSVPYTQPMNFSFDLLAQAKASVERLQGRWDRLREEAAGNSPVATADDNLLSAIDAQLSAFDQALDDNLNTPQALAAVFGLVSTLNARSLTSAEATRALAAFDHFDGVLEVLDRRVRSGVIQKAQLDAKAATISLAEDAAGSAVGEVTPDRIEHLLAARQAAKKARDFARADAIRAALKRAGVGIEDVATGVRWKLD